MYREELLQTLNKLYVNVDNLSSSLFQLYAGKLNCQKGCHSCCADELEVFGIEAENIRRSNSLFLNNSEPHPEGKCAFLDNEGACRIYNSRPMVCRTHGLPLGWKVLDNGKEVEYRDICELNSDHLHPETLSGQQVLPMTQIDEKLATLQLMADKGKLEKVRLRDLFNR